jgi:hypothetical protein
MKRNFSKALGVTGGLAALLLAGGAQAQDGPNYNYLQFGYLHVDFDDTDVDGEAWSLGGSAAITDMFHVIGSYDDGDLDGDFGVDVDFSRLRLGAGINYALTSTTDLVGDLYYLDVEVDPDGPGEADEDGFGLKAGVRSMLSDQLELNGGLRYEDLGGDLDDETSIYAGAVYSFTEQWGVYGGAEFGDDASEYGIGARFYFR